MLCHRLKRNEPGFEISLEKRPMLDCVRYISYMFCLNFFCWIAGTKTKTIYKPRNRYHVGGNSIFGRFFH